MAYSHIDEMKAKTTASGVQEAILLSMEQTSSRKLEVRSMFIGRGKQTAPREYRGDTMGYVLCGRATLTIRQLTGDWEYPLNNDSAIWMPPMSSYFIRNMGDAEMRYIEFSTEIDKGEDIDFIRNQHLSQIVDRLLCPKKNFVHYFEHTLFTARPEAKKLLWGGYHTLYPGGFLPRHVENLDCEETMYVTRGTGIITSGDSKHEVLPGSLVYVPSHTLHSIQNTGKDLMEVLLYESHP